MERQLSVHKNQSKFECQLKHNRVRLDNLLEKRVSDKVILLKYYKHLKKGAQQSHLGRHKTGQKPTVKLG